MQAVSPAPVRARPSPRRAKPAPKPVDLTLDVTGVPVEVGFWVIPKGHTNAVLVEDVCPETGFLTLREGTPIAKTRQWRSDGAIKCSTVRVVQGSLFYGRYGSFF